MTLSYSSIQRHGYTFENQLYGCQFSYYLRYIKQIPPTEIDSKNWKFEKILHSVFEHFYPSLNLSAIRDYPSPKNYFDIILGDLLNKNWDYTLSETAFKDAVSTLLIFSQNESNKYLASLNGETQFMPIHLELPLKEPYNICIDKVLFDHSMMNYKTAKELPDSIKIEHILQAGIYAIDYHAKFGIWPPKMVFYYVRHNKPIIVNITQPVINIVTEISNNVTENINNGKFTKNSNACTWCDMRHVCGLEKIRLI
ncbi:MAG: PD-(D/E)XK nuclease family protein [Pedobacter sp.]|uniref:PD-(D/E)XK nuclease family protein n=1 Tax=Pedobacter sp. TaxID=1411316 RepID=UPI003563B955